MGRTNWIASKVDPSKRRALSVTYVQLCSWSSTILSSIYFNNFLMICIGIAGANVGVQTYKGMDTNAVCNAIDTSLWCVFTVEIALKVMAEGVTLHFFASWWNIYDSVLVIASIPWIPFPNTMLILRLFRLSRLVKIFESIPQVIMGELTLSISPTILLIYSNPGYTRTTSTVLYH